MYQTLPATGEPLTAGSSPASSVDSAVVPLTPPGGDSELAAARASFAGGAASAGAAARPTMTSASGNTRYVVIARLMNTPPRTGQALRGHGRTGRMLRCLDRSSLPRPGGLSQRSEIPAIGLLSPYLSDGSCGDRQRCGTPPDLVADQTDVLVLAVVEPRVRKVVGVARSTTSSASSASSASRPARRDHDPGVDSRSAWTARPRRTPGQSVSAGHGHAGRPGVTVSWHPSSIRVPYALQGVDRSYDYRTGRAVEQVSASSNPYSGRA